MFAWNPGQISVPHLKWNSIFERVFEASLWCDSHASILDPTGCLRSLELRPPLVSKDRDESVCCVGISRSHGLGGKTASTAFPALHGGKLLAYFPDANLADGAAEAASRGFFDVNNTPPWDSWVAYFEDSEFKSQRRDFANYLVAYVPAVMVETAGAGIIVNPEECIAWLDQTNTQLKRGLMRLGVIE